MDQGFAGRSRQKGSYYVGVGDVRELIALSGKAPDVPAEGFISLLAAVLEVPWVSRAFVRALEVTHKDLHQIRPTLNSIGRQVLQPCSSRIGQEQREIANDEVAITRTTGLACKPIVFEPKPGVCFSRIFRDVGRRLVPWRESSIEDVMAEGLRAR